MDKGWDGSLAMVFDTFVGQVRLEALSLQLSDATDQNSALVCQPRIATAADLEEAKEEVAMLKESLLAEVQEKERLKDELEDVSARLEDAEEEIGTFVKVCILWWRLDWRACRQRQGRLR